MGTTQQVNFRAESQVLEKVKEKLTQQGLTLSDVLNATLRKLAVGAVDPVSFVKSDLVVENKQNAAFEELKKEILRGHEAILSSKTVSLQSVRKEFGLD